MSREAMSLSFTVDKVEEKLVSCGVTQHRSYLRLLNGEGVQIITRIGNPWRVGDKVDFIERLK